MKDVDGLHMIERQASDLDNYSYFPIVVSRDYPLSRDELFEKLKENNEISLEKKFANIKKLSTISTFIKEELFKRNYKNYTDVFQKFGDNLRLYGDINSKNKTKEHKNNFHTRWLSLSKPHHK